MPLTRRRLHVEDPLLGSIVGVVLTAGALVIVVGSIAMLLYMVTP
jgi:hypothetical protein